VLWADPEENQHPEWAESERGVSYVFNDNVVHNFAKKFDIDLIARGHQV
jgi:diadenosine tetraphosphatase ApaH/serine/threonine PP2A family protein phosphatase